MLEFRNRVQNSELLDLQSIQNFQGNLKTLNAPEYEQLRTSIVRLGFIAPVMVWKSEQGPKILDGHQRVFAVKKMRDEEGLKVDKLPVVWIDAEDENEAKTIVLALSSHYATISKEGFADFMTGFPVMELQDLPSMINFPDFDLGKELDMSEPEPPEKKEKTCPACGSKF